MSGEALLCELIGRGISVRRVGENVGLKAPPGVITPELRARVIEIKAELLDAIDVEVWCGTRAEDLPPEEIVCRALLGIGIPLSGYCKRSRT